MKETPITNALFKARRADRERLAQEVSTDEQGRRVFRVPISDEELRESEELVDYYTEKFKDPIYPFILALEIEKNNIFDQIEFGFMFERQFVNDQIESLRYKYPFQ